jgi:hypothetical protein
LEVEKMIRQCLIRSVVGLVTIAALPGMAAHAAVMTLGNSGWTAYWEDPNVDLAVDFSNSSVVVIQKFVNFTQPFEDGQFATVSILFEQTRADAARHIIINDEILVNNTQKEWEGFVFTLADLPQAAATDVKFDPGLSNVGLPGGFSINPFTDAVFSDNDRTLTVSGGGTIPSGVTAGQKPENVWDPGIVSGGLFIDANPDPQQPLRRFVLVEQPIPEPAALGLLALAGVALIRRRG